MNKIGIFGLGIVLVVGAIVFATQGHHDHDGHHHDHDHENRVEHYAAQEIKTTKQALETLKENYAKVSKITESETLSGEQLEKIHEISYTLEAAIDKLIAEKAGAKTILESVDEAVQAVHYASEKHEEVVVREWAPKLGTSIDNIDLASVETAAGSEGKDAQQADNTYLITIKDHKFTPDEIRVPAGQKLKLIVDNQDPTPEEFESDDFRREKIIAGNTKATIFVSPLKPGKYHFFGEFNLDSANGYIIAE